MSHPVIPAGAQPCLWMSGGLLTYRLCDREFECDGCPLDAALRGDPLGTLPHEALLVPDCDSGNFPDDRLYTTGHLWIQAAADCQDGTLQCGLDAFAAVFIGRCCRVTYNTSARVCSQGETLCQIDMGMGTLRIGAPVRGTLVDTNPTLPDRPNQLVTAPYADGWIARLIPADASAVEGLWNAEKARERTRFDLQRFRRQVAMQLLAEDAGRVGRCLADGGEPVTDLRQMLGGRTYVELLRQLIY